MNAENGINIGRLQRFFLRALFVVLVGCLVSACDKYSTSDPTPVSQELAQVRSTLTNLKDQLTKQIDEIDKLLSDPDSGLTDEERANLQKLKEDLQKELDTVNDLIKKVDDLSASGGTVTQEELDNIKKATEEVQKQAEKTLEETKDYVPSELENIYTAENDTSGNADNTILIMQPTIYTIKYANADIEEEVGYTQNDNTRYSSVSGSSSFIDREISFYLSPSTIDKSSSIAMSPSELIGYLGGSVNVDSTKLNKRIVSAWMGFLVDAETMKGSNYNGVLFKLTCTITTPSGNTKNATTSVSRVVLTDTKLRDSKTSEEIAQYRYLLLKENVSSVNYTCAEGSSLDMKDCVFVHANKDGNPADIKYSELTKYGLDLKFELTKSFAQDAKGISISGTVLTVNQQVSESQVAFVRVSLIKKGTSYSKEEKGQTIEAYDYGYIPIGITKN